LPIGNRQSRAGPDECLRDGGVVRIDPARAGAGRSDSPISSVRLPSSARSLLSSRRLALRDRVGDLCCAQDYVAYRAEREGASGCSRADRGLGGRRRFRSLGRQRNIFSAGLTSRPSRCGPTMSGSTGMPCTLRPARNSSDACSIALGRRIAKPGRCRTSRAVRVARCAKLCCAGKPRSPCNGAHIRPRAT
jgi:hypothetical protein